MSSYLSHFYFTERQHHEDEAKRKRGTAKSVCPYYKASALQQMRDEILGTVQDIEQLSKLGRETHSCPYYSTRLAVPPAQVILSIVSLLWRELTCALPHFFRLTCIAKASQRDVFLSVWSLFVSTVGGVALSNVAS